MKPCLDCGKATKNARCRRCDQPRQREHTERANARYASTEYRRNRRLALDRDGRQCRKCGARKGLTAHHIIPKWDGGTDSLGNLVTLCHKHNRQADDAYRGSKISTGEAPS